MPAEIADKTNLESTAMSVEKIVDEFGQSLKVCHSENETKPIWDKTLLPTWKDNNLTDFLRTVRDFTLSKMDVLSSTDHVLQNSSLSSHLRDTDVVHIKHGMGDKKSHEVEKMCWLCAQLASACDVQHVVDIGSGRGYLGCQLALQYQLNVLGVEGEPNYTESAFERAQKLDKLWPNLIQKSRK